MVNTICENTSPEPRETPRANTCSHAVAGLGKTNNTVDVCSGLCEQPSHGGVFLASHTPSRCWDLLENPEATLGGGNFLEESLLLSHRREGL